jgi:hypothetical protein
MNDIIHIQDIVAFHRDSIIRWKESQINFSEEDFLAIVEKNHSFNYQLWHAEDRARREDRGHEFVYHAKRDIDKFNQARNNCMEIMDEWLFTRLNPASPSMCPVHSETPGMMIDRLSILALKAYHMGLQVLRPEVDESHRQQCLQKLQTIEQQQQQLYSCLEQLLNEVKERVRTFRVYHQFKMYNDPTLNPQLYQPKSESL